ncbi:hypothetical protein B2I21_09865 [Chryseobacterium mucoviscidosis]|nr:hypothetical protein B2I21_09865 [Chryseobacterium mucoviscidosis]
MCRKMLEKMEVISITTTAEEIMRHSIAKPIKDLTNYNSYQAVRGSDVIKFHFPKDQGSNLKILVRLNGEPYDPITGENEWLNSVLSLLKLIPEKD